MVHMEYRNKDNQVYNTRISYLDFSTKKVEACRKKELLSFNFPI